MVVFFVKSNENTYTKGRALIQMYRVVSITKRGNTKGRRGRPCCLIRYTLLYIQYLQIQRSGRLGVYFLC